MTNDKIVISRLEAHRRDAQDGKQQENDNALDEPADRADADGAKRPAVIKRLPYGDYHRREHPD